MNRAALNTDEQVLCSKMYSLLTLFPKVVWMDLVVGLFLALKRTPPLIALMAVPFHTLISSKWMLLFPHSFTKHLLRFIFSILYILIWVRWKLKVMLIWIFLVAKDIGHLFKCFSSICVSPFENYSLTCLILNWSISFLLLCYFSSVYVLDTTSLSDVWLKKLPFL